MKFAITDIKNDKMSDLVDKSAKKVSLDKFFSGLSTFSDSGF